MSQNTGGSSAIAAYNQLLSQCRSVNDLNRIHIAFGNTMTPSEVLELEETLFVEGPYQVPTLRDDRAFSDDELRRIARIWIEGERADLKNVRKPLAEPFLRRDIRKSVTLYHNGEGASGRTLLIAFAGGNHRMMMPIPTLLQNLPAKSTDVLMVRDGTRSGYTSGLDGLAPSIEELGSAIPKMLDISQYDRLLGLGVSAGGLPIVLVALQMNFEAVLACGPGSPSREKWQRPGLPSPLETIRAAALDGSSRRITIAYGAQSETDRAAAMEIGGNIPIAMVEVSVPDRDVKHNVLHPLSMAGELPKFFEEHLGIQP